LTTASTQVIFSRLYNLSFPAKWLQKAKATGNAPHYNLIYFLLTKIFEGKTHKTLTFPCLYQIKQQAAAPLLLDFLSQNQPLPKPVKAFLFA
jgi:hypothetical protein